MVWQPVWKAIIAQIELCSMASTLVIDLTGQSSYDIFACLSVLFTSVTAIMLESKNNFTIVNYTCRCLNKYYLSQDSHINSTY